VGDHGKTLPSQRRFLKRSHHFFTLAPIGKKTELAGLFFSAACDWVVSTNSMQNRAHVPPAARGAAFRWIAPALVFLCLAFHAAAEDWPMWRGPRLDGSAGGGGCPVELNDSTLHWKTPIRGSGHASPIVAGDSVFVVSCDTDTNERLLIRLDRDSGAVRWQRPVLLAELEGRHRLNSHASSTPASNGELVFTAFLDGDRVVVSAHDFEGERRWEARPGVFYSKHGFCSSPILHADLVIVNCDHDGDGYMVALDAATGAQRWRVERPNNTRSYCVPLIREIGGRSQMVLSGSRCVASYDPATGARHWLLDGPTEQFVASLVYHPGANLLFMTGGYPEHHLLAIRPDGSGQIGDSHIAWRTNQGVAYVPSPVVAGDFLLIVSDSGVAHCFDARSGRIHWMERVREHHASLAVAGGLVYLVNDFGTVRVVEPAEDFRLVAQSELGEKVFASPAFSGGRVWVRGEKHLMCFSGGVR
jgi:outer membrane protein assembly factor BamB